MGARGDYPGAAGSGASEYGGMQKHGHPDKVSDWIFAILVATHRDVLTIFNFSFGLSTAIRCFW